MTKKYNKKKQRLFKLIFFVTTQSNITIKLTIMIIKKKYEYSFKFSYK